MDLIGQTLKASTKKVLVERDALTISYGALYHGFKGDKRIPYASITAVQHKEPGSWMAGYIQLTVQGAREWHGPVNQDENAFQFDRPMAEHFRALRDFIQQQMARPISGVSLADELTKLANLRDHGVLTDAEFDQQKQRLLSQ